MRYLIWDFDGTLGYREGSMWSGTLFKLVRAALPELGVRLEDFRASLRYFWDTPEQPHPELATADAWWAAFNPSLLATLAQVGVPAERASELAHAFRYAYIDLAAWRVYPDTLPGLARLAAAGWTHVLLSNHVPELPVILDHLDVSPHLAAVFNSADTGYEKPHPQAFRNVLDSLHAAEAVWMIGDNPRADIAGAAALGIPGILVRQEGAGLEEVFVRLGEN